MSMEYFENRFQIIINRLMLMLPEGKKNNIQ